MTHYLCVFLGCGLGGVCRYWLSTFLAKNASTHFPWATFTANLLGCLLIGLLLAHFSRRPSAQWQLFAVMGFCGGFTTFSTFANETLSLLRQACYGTAIAYVTLSVAAGIACVVAGWAFAKH